MSLAPIYDSLTTLAYGELSAKMGTPIGRRIYWSKVDREALLEEGIGFRFDERDTRHLVESLALANSEVVENIDPHLADDRRGNLWSLMPRRGTGRGSTGLTLFGMSEHRSEARVRSGAKMR